MSEWPDSLTVYNPSYPEVMTCVYRLYDAMAVLVPMAWYRQAREALGDPTDL